MPSALDAVGHAHRQLVFRRRVRVLADAIVPLVESGWRVLDVGCGDGLLGRLLSERVDRLNVVGLDVSARRTLRPPAALFDGDRLPVGNAAADAVLLVDVLHHTDDPWVLLSEARRVARRVIIIKDHRLSRPLAGSVLRLMDWVGNRPHGVALPYNYWSEDQWHRAWRELGLSVDHYQTRLGLYRWPASWLFETGLHFITRLVPHGSGSAPDEDSPHRFGATTD